MANQKQIKPARILASKVLPLKKNPVHQEIYWGVVSAIDSTLGKIYPRGISDLYSDVESIERTLAYVDGRIVAGGLVSGPVTTDGFFTIRYAAVRPEFAGRGIGRVLAETFEQRAREAAKRADGIRGIRLNAFNGAVKFYEKQGFVNLKTVLIDGVEHFRMQKEF